MELRTGEPGEARLQQEVLAGAPAPWASSSSLFSGCAAVWVSMGGCQPVGTSLRAAQAPRAMAPYPASRLPALQRAEPPSAWKGKCHCCSSFSPAAVDVLKLRKHLNDLKKKKPALLYQGSF